MPSPTSNLPRISLAITFNDAQLARIEEMIEQYNRGAAGEPMRNYEQAIASGLVALEALLFDMNGQTSVFEMRA